MNCLHRNNQTESLAIETKADLREDKARLAPVEDLIEVEIDGPEKKVRIGAILIEEQMDNLTSLLKKYKELFAWKCNDIPEINIDIISHELQINLSIKPITQKRWSFGSNKHLAIIQEVR